MGIDRKRIVLLLFLFTISPASLKSSTIQNNVVEDNEVLRSERNSEDIKQPSKNVNQKNSKLDSFFSSFMKSMGILDSVTSVIHIGGNNILGPRGKRAQSDYNSSLNENRPKRSILNDENAQNNTDDKTNKPDDIQSNTINEEVTTESNETFSEGIVTNNLVNDTDYKTTLVQNDDIKPTITENNSDVAESNITLNSNNSIVEKETVVSNDNVSTTYLNENGNDDLRSGLSRPYNDETVSDMNQSTVKVDANYSPLDSVADNSTDSTTSVISTTDVMQTSGNSTLTTNETESDVSNNNITDVNETSLQNNSRQAYDTHSDNETNIQETESSGSNQGNASQNNITNDVSSPDNPSELNVTNTQSNINEDINNNQNFNNSLSKTNVENSNLNNNNSLKINIFSNTRKSNSNNNTDTNHNSVTELNDRINNIVLEKISNIGKNNNEIIDSTINDKYLKTIEDSIHKINAVNNRRPDDKPDNVNLNINNNTGNLTYIHNLLVNFYFA